MKKLITLYWMNPGSSRVNTYRAGVDDPKSAPNKGALVFESSVEAAALAAIGECLGFITARINTTKLWSIIGEDPGYWIKKVKECEGDPQPVVEGWLDEHIPQAVTEWEQEQREQVMAALSGLNE